MEFNIKKCKLMRITKKNPIARNLFINGSELEVVNGFKDLGLLTDNILSWNQHVNKITARANKVLGLISRTCGGFHDPATLKTLYCSLVRSQLEYCSVVWSPHAQKCITAIERVQRRACNKIHSPIQ